MLVDIHTNLMWYPDHYSEEFVASSKAIQEFFANHGHDFAERMNEIEIPIGGVAPPPQLAAVTA